MADQQFRVKNGIAIGTSSFVDVNRNIVAGVATFNNAKVVGVATLGIISATNGQGGMGIVTFQSQVAIESGTQTITIAPPSQNAGFVSSYNLTLPSKLGTDGQVLTLGQNGVLGFNTAGLYEARYYVSAANGSDSNDGRSKPFATIKKATQAASFRSFQLPGGRYIDAGNLLNVNKTFIQEEVVGFVTFTYPSLLTNLDYDSTLCKRDVGYVVDAIVYDLSYGGNSKSVESGLAYWNAGTSYVAGESVETIAAYRYIIDLSKKIINNVGVTTSYQLPSFAISQIFDNTISYDNSCNPSAYSENCCANVLSAIDSYVGIVTSIIGIGTTAAPTITNPTTKSKPVAIFVEAGDYVEDNPILLYDDIAIVGDNIRNTIIRPQNAGKDLFRVRNGCYVTGFAMKDYADAAGVPQFTFDNAVSFDDPSDTSTSRSNYASKTTKPIITRSPYIQNCSILSFLGANGIFVDGSKVLSPNQAIIKEESENPVIGAQPQFGKSMVAAAFTMVSFGGIGWRTINDGYAQVVSCFQIFCKYGSLTQSGGYLSITNSATNFGLYALRSTGFSQNSFAFDRGRIAATGTSSGLQTLRAVGLGRSDQNLYVLRFVNGQFADATSNFKPIVTQAEFNATTGINTSSDRITIIGHPFSNGDTILYLGDENASPKSIVGGLISGNQYYLSYVDTNNFELYEDNSLTRKVNLISSAVGINTIQKGNSEFFVKEVIDAHTSYQNISIGATAGTPQFTSGKEVTQVVTGGTAVGYAVTYNASKRELLISVESQGGIRKFFGVSGSESNLSIQDHSSSPISLGITAVTGISTYHTVEFTVDSTVSGTTITGIASLPKDYQVYFNRPSTINANAHAWEYSGSGTDYNALPQNGGKTVSSSEQVNELGGRVYSTGTNELGDFKVGNFITAYNRTGNIIFNNKVTIGQIDSLNLSLSGGVSISQFSTDVGLGDNEIGGAQNYRVATQLATRTFLGNRLGNFIDKTLSSNAVPSAVVQLNSFGQINSDLIPPKIVNYYRANVSGGRTDIVNQIPATNIQNGDTVLEPGVGYVLIADTYGQYLILNDTTRNYNFNNNDVVISTNSGGGAIGIVTTPPVNAVGYGTTGLVKGVLLNVTVTSGGSGYTNPGIYTCVLDNATGIGTSARAAITVGASGTVTSVNVNFGGRKYASGDIITINTPSLIGGRTGGANFTATVSAIETRLYLKLTNNQKFAGSSILSDYIADNDAIGITTNIQVGYGKTFDPTDVSTGGSIDFNFDRIIVGLSTFTDGDPVIYSANGGNVLVGLSQNYTYYAKRVGITSIELYTSYALSSKVDFTGNGSGTHTITRVGINTVESHIVFERHGLGTGDAVKVTGEVPVGVTTGNFYFIGSVVPNAFTLHAARADAVASLNGTSFNPVSFASTGPGIAMTFTKQNVTYSATVNTSSNIFDNWTVLASGTIDASNITSGTISPSRLGGGTANSDTFLRGDSSYARVVSAVGIGTTEPITATATSQDSAPGGIGINTYYGKLNITLNRAASTLDTYSTLGVSKFRTSTFSIGDDGSVSIKGSSNGDVDAATLSGQSGAYYLNPVNFTSSIPISRGGTGLSALPSAGSILQGNGTSYDLVTSPTLAGNLTLTNGGNFIAVGAAITNANITGFGTVNYLGNINAVHTGIVSFTGTGNNINHTSGTATLNNVNVTGVTTVGTLNYTSLSGTAGASIPFLTNTNTVHSGIVTFSGTGNNINCTAGTQVFNNSVFSGISTFLGQVNVGTANYTSATVGGTLQTNNFIVTGVTTAGRLQVSDTIAATTLTVSGVTTVGTLYFTSLGGTAGASIPYLTNTNTVVSGIATFTGTDNNIQQTNGTAALNRLTVSGISTFTGLINYGSISGTTITNSGTAGLTNATVSGVTTFSGSGNNINQSAGTAAINRLTVAGISTFTGQLNAGTISASSLIGTLNNTLTINSPLTGTSYNNSGAVTLGINATSANTANYVVQRGASGEFSMGALTASSSTFSNYVRTLEQVRATGWYGTPTGSSYTGLAVEMGMSAGQGYVICYNRDTSTYGTLNLQATGSAGISIPASGTTITVTGAISGNSTITGTQLISNIATGTAPLTVTSTTQVTNLNAQYHNGLLSATANTGSTIVARDASGNFSMGGLTATTGNFSSTLTVGGAIVRSSAGSGYLSGNYSSVETTSTTMPIYTIGGSYFPTSSSLNTMYGIGYAYGTVAYATAGTAWGLYVCSAGTTKHFLDSDNGVAYATASHRSQLFYDLNDTGYYCDPNGTSSLNAIFRTNTRVAIAQKVPLGHYTPGETVFEIDPTWTDTEIRNYFNSNNVSWVADSTAPGGYAISIVGNVNVGGVYTSGFPYIPVDQDDIFYMECWVKNVSTNNAHYMGSIDYNESFGNLGGNPGSFGYWVMSNSSPGAPVSAWVKYCGYIGGFSASTTGTFKTGTKYFTPQALFNYSGGGTTYISGWKCIKVTNYGSRTIIGRTASITGENKYALDVYHPIDYYQLRIRAASQPLLKFSGAYNSGNGAEIWQNTSGNLYFNINGSSTALTSIPGPYTIIYGSARSPIFYDQDNTAYYDDPASTSRIVSTIIGGHGGTAYDTASSGRLYIGTNADNAYSIYTHMENYGGNYTKLTLDWHTGIKIGAYYGYGGIRFYNNSIASSGTEVFSVARGDSNVRVNNDLYVGISQSSSNIYMYDSDEGTRRIHCNSNRVGFLNQSDGWGAYCSDNGDWTTDTISYAGTSHRSPIFYDSDNTGYYLDPNSTTFLNLLRCNNWLYLDQNYGHSIVGAYSATRYQGVFAMGDSYKLAADGTTTGSLYGLAWSHPNAGGAAANLSNHGLLVLLNGTYYAAISGSIRCITDMRTPIYYDSDNTAYYLDPASSSELSSFTAATYTRMDEPFRKFNRQAYNGDSNYWTGTRGWGTTFTWDTAWSYGFGGFDIWGTSTGHPQGAGYVHAQGIQSGLHYALSDGSAAYGWQLVGAADAGTRLWMRGKWGGSTTAWRELAMYGVNVGGNLYADVFYDSNDTGYYIDPASTSDSALRIRGGALHGPNPTWGSYLLVGGDGRQNRINDSAVASVCSTNGNLHLDAASGYVTYINHYDGNAIYFGGGANNNWGEWSSGILYSYADTRSPIFYDYNNTGYYTDPASTSNLNSVSMQGGNVYGVMYFHANRNTSSDSPPLQAYSSNGSGAIMSFHRGGYYAVNFGLDSDNVMRIGGWSASANRWQLDMSGNMTAAGTVTANSDIKLKENIEVITDALERVSKIRGVTFTRNDQEDKKKRHVGVIAQEVEKVLPEVVMEGNDGIKSVAYGNLVGLLIEAIKEQQMQINELKNMIINKNESI